MTYAYIAIVIGAVALAAFPWGVIWLVGQLIREEPREEYDNGPDDGDMPTAA